MSGQQIKQIIFLFLLFSLMVPIFYFETFFSHFVIWGFQKYIDSRVDGHLDYENISYHHPKLVIVKPGLGNASQYQAEKMVLTFDFDLWKRLLYIDIVLEQPQFHFSSSLPSTKEKIVKIMGQEGKWLTVRSKILVNQGFVQWKLDDMSIHKAIFDFETNYKNEVVANIGLIPSESNELNLLLSVSNFENGFLISSCYKNVCCKKLSALFKLFGFDNTSWKLFSGSISGNMNGHFPSENRPFLEGEIQFDNLDFEESKTNLKGRINQANLRLKKNESAYKFNNNLPTVTGKLDFIKTASLSYESDSKKWNLENMRGSLELNEEANLLISLQGLGEDDHYHTNWDVFGKANLDPKKPLDANLYLSCRSSDEPEGSISFLFSKGKQEERYQAQMEMKSLSYKACDFLQTMAATYWPHINRIKWKKGELNALLEVDLSKNGIGKVRLNHFQIDNLNVFIKPWGAISVFGQIEGHGSAHLDKESFWDTLEAELHIENGEMEWVDKPSLLPLKGIQAQLLYQHGKMEHSLITLQLGNLKGVLDLEWGNIKKLFNLKLTGKFQDIAPLFPIHLQEGLRRNFSEKPLVILASLEKFPHNFELTGTVQVPGDSIEQNAYIHFGCEWRKIDEICRSTFVPQGRFFTHDLSIEKFISPFLFRDGVLRMSGSADLKGELKGKRLAIFYNAQNVKLENEDLSMEVKNMRSPEPGAFLGYHEIDLEKKTHWGNLPIQNGTYLEKNTGLHFKNIKGLVAFKNQTLKWNSVEADCESVFVKGEISMDYSDPAPGVFSVSIQCPQFLGKISDIQRLLGKMKEPSPLQKIPLEGECTGKDQGLTLHFDFFPKKHHLIANLQGRITGGEIAIENSEIALKEIDVDFDYDHSKDLLRFTDIHGALLIGKPSKMEEYRLKGEHIFLHQLTDPDVELDIAFLDRGYELFRFNGLSLPQGNGIHQMELNLILSHFSGIFPKQWMCLIKDWTTLLSFNSYFNLDVGLIIKDLSRFQRTGLLGISSQLIEKLNKSSFSDGNGELNLYYDPVDESLHYITSFKVREDGKKEHDFQLEGRKKGQKWIFDHLMWDEWNLAAEFEKNGILWKIPFLGLKFKNSFLVGISGDFNPEPPQINAKLNVCEIDCQYFEQLKPLKNLVKTWQPKGLVHAIGEFECDLSAPSFYEGFSGSFQIGFKNMFLRNYPLTLKRDFQIDLKKNESFTLKDMHLELAPKSSRAIIDIPQLSYNRAAESLICPQCDFHLPPSSLMRVVRLIHEEFPDYFDSQALQDFIDLDFQNGLGGVFLWEHQEGKNNIHLRLDDGWYSVKGNPYEIKQIDIELTKDLMYFSALSKHEQVSFQINGQTLWPSRERGSVRIIDLSTSQSTQPYQPLVINWEKHPEQKMILRSVQGNFSGCSFNLAGLNSDISGRLNGFINIDPNLLTLALPIGYYDKLKELKLGSPYKLEGLFWTDFNLGSTLLETVYFQGKLTSKEASLKGYKYEYMEADMHYSPGKLLMKNFSLKDDAGTLFSPYLFIEHLSSIDKWAFQIPQMAVKNFRPALLREKDPATVSNPKFRSLLIKRIEFTQLNGFLNDSLSWQGKGSMFFLNAFRKNSYHPLLSIPGEIILRLGLDPHVLNPVTGSINFDIKEGKFYLTKFKDVYSEGRGSKFYLAENEAASWMDFDGNLFIHFRMKHYNLIFKLTELFTVSVQGDLKKPRYSLQKQQKSSSKSTVK